MPEINSPTCASAFVPPVGGPRSLDVNAIDSALMSMTGLINLLEWIGNARDFIEGIETGKRVRPEFAEQLKNCDFSDAEVDWSYEAAEGLSWLHYALREQIDLISKAVRAGVQQ